MTIFNDRGRIVKVTLLVLAAVFVSAPARADDLVTIKGKRYEKVRVTEITPVTIAFTHSSGVARLPFTELGPDVQKKFGYDEAKARAWLAEQARVAAAAEQARKEESARKRQQATEVQQQVEQMAAALGNTVYDGATHRWYHSQEEAAFARERALKEALQARSDAGR